jgi:hypothetical protein
MTAGSLAFNLCMFFAKNPGAVIYSDEIVRRWAVGRRSIFSQLEPTRKKGFIVGTKKPGDAHMYFEAGPALINLMEGL